MMLLDLMLESPSMHVFALTIFFCREHHMCAREEDCRTCKRSVACDIAPLKETLASTQLKNHNFSEGYLSNLLHTTGREGMRFAQK